MNRLKVNWPHQNIYDEINDKLWKDQILVHEYQKMWQDTMINHYSKVQRDELRELLKEKLDKFYKDFLCGCEQIIEDIFSQYIGEYKTKEILYKLENELESTLVNYITNWKQYISPLRTFNVLLEILSYEDISKLRYPKYYAFVVDNYSDEVTLNMEIIWRKVFNYLGISNNELNKQIDDNVTFYL